MTRLAKFVDITKCTGCRGCQVACKQWNDLPAEIGPFTGSYQSHEDLSAKRYTLIRFVERQQDGEVKWDFYKQQCMHCGDAACVRVCPQNALDYTDYGAVIRDEDKCIGCGYCVTNCTFSITKMDKEREKATKCDLCHERVVNHLKPACVSACLSGAIQFGRRDQLVAMAEARLDEVRADNPEANLYGINAVGGTGSIYLLPAAPTNYGLPANPKVPATVGLWKDIFQPLGTIIVGASVAATALGFLATRGKAWREDALPDKVKKGGPTHGA